MTSGMASVLRIIKGVAFSVAVTMALLPGFVVLFMLATSFSHLDGMLGDVQAQPAERQEPREASAAVAQPGREARDLPTGFSLRRGVDSLAAEAQRISAVEFGTMLAAAGAAGLASFLILMRRRGRVKQELSCAIERIGHLDCDVAIPEVTDSDGAELASSLRSMVMHLRRSAVSRSYFDLVLQSLRDGVIETDTQDNVRMVNPAATRMLRAGADELLGLPMRDILDLDVGEYAKLQDFLRRNGCIEGLETRLNCRLGQPLPVNLSASVFKSRDGEPQAVVYMLRRVRLEQEPTPGGNPLRDARTGLSSRALFMDRLEHSLRQAERDMSHTVGLLLLAIDLADERLGEAGADGGRRVLTTVAERLAMLTRSADTLAVHGEGVFAFLLEDIGEAQRVRQVAERMLDGIEEPIPVVEGGLTVRAWAGGAFAGARAATAGEMLSAAEAALAAAGAEGKGQYVLFDESFRAVQERGVSETELRRAVVRGEFEIHYQPLVEIEGERIAGFEALVRWKHPDRRVIMPLDFIAQADQEGLIIPIGRFVLESCASQVKAWRESYPEKDLFVSVNIAFGQVREGGLLEDVLLALASAGLEPEALALEFPESLVVAHHGLMQDVMRELKRHGVRLVVDDFGAVGAPGGYLAELPVDLVKLAPGTAARKPGLAESGAPGSEGPALSAKCVESDADLVRAREAGCRYCQGYRYASPLPARSAQRLLDQGLGQAPLEKAGE